MKRWIVGLGIVTMLTTGQLATSVASASPTNNTTSITLVCDKNTGSTVRLTLQPSSSNPASLADVEIKCGLNSELDLTRNRVTIPTGHVSAGYVSITAWTVTTSGQDCADAGPITYKATCPQASSPGAQLVVR